MKRTECTWIAGCLLFAFLTAAASAQGTAAHKAAAAPKVYPTDEFLVPSKLTLDDPLPNNAVPLTLEVLSVSSRTITAYTVSFTYRYPVSPAVKVNKSVELIQETISPGSEGPSLLFSHATGRVRATAPAGREGDSIKAASVEVLAIIFDNRTAIGNPTTVASLMNARMAASRECTATLKELQAVQAEPDVVAAMAGKDPNAAGILKRALLRRISQPTPGVPRARRDADLNYFASILQAGIAYFQHEVANYKKMQETLADQSTLK